MGGGKRLPMKKIIAILAFCGLAYGGLNNPITINMCGGSLYTTYHLACDCYTNYCLSGITNGGKLWQHVGVINQATSALSLSAISGNATSPPPDTNTVNKYPVYAYGTSAWDDIAVFNNLFVQMEGATTATGNIFVTVW